MVRVPILALCALLSFASAAPDWDERSFLKYLVARVEEVRTKCEQVSGATDDDLDAIDAGKIPRTQTGKCMIACEFMEYGLIDGNKKYNKDGIFEMLPRFLRDDKSLDGFKSLTERCEKAVAKVDGDECELAAKLKLCFQQHASEYGMKNFLGIDGLDYGDDSY